MSATTYTYLEGIVIERDLIRLDPILGPLCDRQEAEEDSGGCMHDTCQDIDCNGRLSFAMGPLCGGVEYLGYCDHGSCSLIEPDQLYCEKHGWVLVLSHERSRGFAGGSIYWALLSCDDMYVDESDDVRAAL